MSAATATKRRGLILPAKADVQARLDVPDRSGLSPLDWQLIRIDNVFRAADEAAENVVRVQRTLVKLAAKLDDPALAANYPPTHPERIAAEQRHWSLVCEGKRERETFRDAAKDVDRLFTKLPPEGQRVFGDPGRSWDDSPVWDIARLDPACARLRWWIDGITRVDGRRGKPVDEPPF